MGRIKKPLIIIAVFLAAALLSGAGQYFYYYPGTYQPPPPDRPPVEDIVAETAAPEPFTDQYQVQEGKVLIDLAHYNYYWPQELSLLHLRLISRGYSLDYLRETAELEEQLAESDAFVVILPGDPYMDQDVEVVEEFVDRGGKLFLVGDPARYSEINSLAMHFGLIFETDYLYNMTENEGNFRYIHVSDFDTDQPLVEDVDTITLFTAGTISSDQKGIAFTCPDTYSSVGEHKQAMSPVALTGEGRVLAVSDLLFMTEPYNASTDNNQFIANIADWMTTPEEVDLPPDVEADLAYFPDFLESEGSIAYSDLSLLGPALQLEAYLDQTDRTFTPGRYRETMTGDLIFLGLYAHAQQDAFPAFSLVSVQEDAIIVNDYEDIDREGSAVIFLEEAEDWRAVAVLASSEAIVEKMADYLIDGQFLNLLVSDHLAVYRDDDALDRDLELFEQENETGD